MVLKCNPMYAQLFAELEELLLEEVVLLLSTWSMSIVNNGCLMQ